MKSLIRTLLCLTTILLTACESSTPVKIGKQVLVSPCTHFWSEIDLAKNLSDYEGCDILTEKTARDIYDNNEILRD